jgi:hypothetical protein
VSIEHAVFGDSASAYAYASANGCGQVDESVPVAQIKTNSVVPSKSSLLVAVELVDNRVQLHKQCQASLV